MKCRKDLKLTDYDACAEFYSEHVHFDYNNGGYSNSTGHFTAMVWKVNFLQT